ncbi:MAG: HAD-IIIA family hydrolase, partial [Bryobacteraceae bacterium]
LQSLGLRLVIVTNQQGIGLGYFTLDDFIAVNQALLRQLAPHGVKISKIYFCPHSLADGCPCRKPGTRLLERALKDFGFPPQRAFLIGDTNLDFDAAAVLGVPSFRVSENDAASWPAAAEAIARAVERWS